MKGLIDWAGAHTRMVLTLVVMTLGAGVLAYTGLPKEGEPDIEVPAVIITVPFPGITATDGETLLIRPMETELSDLDDLRTMTAFSADGFAGMVLEFEFGWDKTATLADVRDAMNRAQGSFPAGADNYSIAEFNFSQFPIIIVAVSGEVSERALLRAAEELERAIESIDAVLEVNIAGARDEMVEVIIDPLRLEAYNVTADELLRVITRNNQLVAAGDITTVAGAFGVTVPSTFRGVEDVYALPIKVNGDSVVRLGDLADIRLTFEDRAGTARFNGETNIALQVVMRRGFNIIDTAAEIRAVVAQTHASWPEELRDAIRATPTLDRSDQVGEMVSQLETSVMTAIALVMIVVLAALGLRSAMLVGIAIPTSFMLCFILLGLMGVSISNIVMFGLILAVGILVDGAVVVAEYADNRLARGDEPMKAYTSAAKRMFWPITASTATTLCAFLPMLFWPGVAGEFMGMLPITLIFVLTASLIVALVFLPVLGGVTGRLARHLGAVSAALRRKPLSLRLALPLLTWGALFAGVMLLLNPSWPMSASDPGVGVLARLPGAVLVGVAAIASSVALSAVLRPKPPSRVIAGHFRSPFGRLIRLLVGNPVMPVVTIVAVAALVVGVFQYYGENNRGVEFFVETEPEQGIIFVRARGNLSLDEKDALVRQVEAIALSEPGVEAVFAFAGDGGLNTNTAGVGPPGDTIGQIQFELTHWTHRQGVAGMRGQEILERMQAQFDLLHGIQTEFLIASGGPAGAKPVHLRLTGADFATLEAAVETVLARFAETDALIDIEDTRPVPGVDWQINVDVDRAGRFGADVATVGGMIQLVTRGILLDTMRVDSSDDEIEIRVRLPQADRLLSTLDDLRVQTQAGLVPLSNFITREPVARRGQIDRVNRQRFFDVKADVAAGQVRLVDPAGRTVDVVGRELLRADRLAPGSPERARADAIAERVADEGLRKVAINPNERIAVLTEWLEASAPLPAGIDWAWTGEQQDQQESTEFLVVAFSAALGLMFVILLTQFNSFYNSVLVLLAVVLSSTGVLIGMLVMDQTFSVIMTGTGVVALAGIVVNNNIVLIDTYQSYAAIMPRIEAIIRTAEARLRPVLMTTITTMAGLTPMMLGLSIDFVNGGFAIDSPVALWWKQLATAVVFGLGVATVLTLLVTPALLALRVWLEQGAYRGALELGRVMSARDGAARRDRLLDQRLRNMPAAEIVWEDLPNRAAPRPTRDGPLHAPPDHLPVPLVLLEPVQPAATDPGPLHAAQ